MVYRRDDHHRACPLVSDCLGLADARCGRFLFAEAMRRGGGFIGSSSRVSAIEFRCVARGCCYRSAGRRTGEKSTIPTRSARAPLERRTQGRHGENFGPPQVCCADLTVTHASPIYICFASSGVRSLLYTRAPRIRVLSSGGGGDRRARLLPHGTITITH